MHLSNSVFLFHGSPQPPPRPPRSHRLFSFFVHLHVVCRGRSPEADVADGWGGGIERKGAERSVAAFGAATRATYSRGRYRMARNDDMGEGGSVTHKGARDDGESSRYAVEFPSTVLTCPILSPQSVVRPNHPNTWLWVSTWRRRLRMHSASTLDATAFLSSSVPPDAPHAHPVKPSTATT